MVNLTFFLFFSPIEHTRSVDAKVRPEKCGFLNRYDFIFFTQALSYASMI